jgi:hypothetical protein
MENHQESFKGTAIFRHKNGISIVTPELITIIRNDGTQRDFPNRAEEKKHAESFIGHRL